ncbi:MerR family transcriptional regulator [Atopomonas sediminilitoris]|uniref:MerR family transcriptional regulator n=1 Tax=Atopomonas sediminilitoris TaxID=2919919 RepID=UPI001F4EE3C3|nr:MerR family transcriptional regulator [Atopomonas sediminilitoris]MCJ8170195.1 MerR family transcriptional regulator [Atopomonas sediminilitoris]
MSASKSSSPSPQQDLFPIREVVRLTGIHPVTLRAWERRYALIVPTRTESGHRLYCMEDVERVRNIMAWIERGVAVSKIGDLLAKHNQPASEPVQASGEYEAWQLRVLQAVEGFSERELERHYGQLFALYSPLAVFTEVLLPVWQRLLIAQEQYGKRSQWLMLDTFLRGRVLQRLQLGRRGEVIQVLLCAPAGQSHELEWLLAGLALQEAGVTVQLLSAEQPLAELALVCARVKPQVAVVFAQKPFATDWLDKPLEKLNMALDCELGLAGAGAELAEARLQALGIACLGAQWHSLAQRTQRWLQEQLDT